MRRSKVERVDPNRVERVPRLDPEARDVRTLRLHPQAPSECAHPPDPRPIAASEITSIKVAVAFSAGLGAVRPEL